MTKEERRAYNKAYYKANKEQYKAYYAAHREQVLEQKKAWYDVNKEEAKAYYEANKAKRLEQIKAYMKSDINSLGQTKQSIRVKSNQFLSKYGQKIQGYQIHHCCSYTEPYKFIYCSKEMHRLIHAYLRQHNIDADCDHYAQIKHLLDEHVVKYGID